MSKKILTAEEKVKKYGRNIAGVGIFYLICFTIIISMRFSELLNPVNLIMYGVQLAIIIAMVIGGIKRTRLAATAGWIFEGYLIIATILSLLLGLGGPDLIALIVMIGLPSDIKSFSKALEEVNNPKENQEYTSSNI